MILITGCTGYIGSRLCLEFLKSGRRVRGLILPEETNNAQALADRGMELWTGDLLKHETLRGIEKGISIVYHLAGLHSSSIEKMERLYVQGTHALLNLLKYSSIQAFIAASSGAIYGDCGDELLTEKHTLIPKHPFGLVSLKYEQLIEEFCREVSIPFSILRIAEVYGPQKYNPLTLAGNDHFSLLGNGTNYTSKIHIEDLLSILKMAPEKLATGEPYNVCDDLPVVQKEFYTEVARIMGGPCPKWIPEHTVPDRILLSIHGLRSLSIRMSNLLIKNVLNYDFTFPTFYEGLKHLKDQI